MRSSRLRRRHDDGVKTVLGHTGNFDGGDLITILTHSEASHRWISTRVWSRFAKTLTTDPALDTLIATYAEHLNIGALMTATFTSPSFLADQGRAGQAAGRVRRGCVARIENASRQSDLPGIPASSRAGAVRTAERWRLAVRRRVAHDRGELHPHEVRAFRRYARRHFGSRRRSRRPARADAAAHLLSVDSWGAQTRVALAQVAQDPASVMTLALCAPEYVVN